MSRGSREQEELVKLYNYFRSSAAYRVRIALALKGLSYEYLSVNLPKGEQYLPEYTAINPQNLVPVLEEEGQPLVSVARHHPVPG